MTLTRIHPKGASLLALAAALSPTADADVEDWRQAVSTGTPPTYMDWSLPGPTVIDLGATNGTAGVSYEFVVLGNAAGESPCLMGARSTGVGDQSGLKFEQYLSSYQYGVTEFNVQDHFYSGDIAVNRNVHLVFVSNTAANTTELWVDGVSRGTVPASVTLQGMVGVGQAHDPVFGDFDVFAGTIHGVAVYEGQLSPAEITAHRDAYYQNGTLSNPSFETGDFRGWDAQDFVNPYMPMQVATAGPVPMSFLPAAPTDGSFSCMNSFDAAGPDTARLRQVVTVDPNATTLAFDYRAGWDMQFPSPATQDREFSVVIRQLSAIPTVLYQETFIVAQAGTAQGASPHAEGLIDLSPFAGQTVSLSFEWFVPEVFAGPASAELDHVRFLPNNVVSACSAAMEHCGSNLSQRPSGPVELSASFGGPGAVHLEAEYGPAGSFGYFLISAGLNEPGVQISNGLLCLAAPVGRFNPLMAQLQGDPAFNSISVFDPFGTFSNIGGTSFTGTGFDVPLDLPVPPGPGTILPGSTYHFQCWFRCGTGSNFSNAISVTFP